MHIFKSLLLIFLILSCSQNKMNADLIIDNANVVTMNPNQEKASLIAIKSDKIIFVGDLSQKENITGSSTKVFDAKGKTVIPGFIDAHAHFLSLGNSLITIDLNTIKNWHEAITLVKTAVEKSKPDEWITGRGWHQEKWEKVPSNSIKGYPAHNLLSSVSPNNPVMLSHASGHGIMANAKAMELADINKKTISPEGGEIIRDNNGEATGIFLETAEELINDKYLEYIESLNFSEQRKLNIQKIDAATTHCLENGVTSFHDAGAYFKEIDLYKDLAEKDSLALRLWVMISSEEKLSDSLLQAYKMIGFGNDHLTVRAIKQYVDGALGSRGAWMLKPYSDVPSTAGLNVTPLDSILHVAERAYKNDYQLCTHAIGDRGNREMLDLYKSVLSGHLDKRWRIEHAQHLALDDINRFAELGIIASMQTVHCTSDGIWVPKRIGDKRAEQGAYVWQKLLQANALIANGTDAPVEHISPIANFYAAVTRRLSDGSRFYPNQVLTREQALASLTIWNAYAGFEEDIKGSIETGKLADLVILSQDILTIPEEQIPETQVLATILGGKIKYEK